MGNVWDVYGWIRIMHDDLGMFGDRSKVADGSGFLDILLAS
jgi:hypothetical protein